MIHLKSRPVSFSPANNPPRHPGHGTMRWNRREYNTARAYLGALTDFNVTQNLCAGANQNA
jgi:hypothetical protein